MNTNIFSGESMKEAMKKALQQNQNEPPSVITLLFELVAEVQDALHENGYSEALFEIRQGLQTSYGQRYTVYLRDNDAKFESVLFSLFVGDDQYALQADGQIEIGLDTEAVLQRVRMYLLKPHIVQFMTGLLNQFRTSNTSSLQQPPIH